MSTCNKCDRTLAEALRRGRCSQCTLPDPSAQTPAPDRLCRASVRAGPTPAGLLAGAQDDAGDQQSKRGPTDARVRGLGPQPSALASTNPAAQDPCAAAAAMQARCLAWVQWEIDSCKQGAVQIVAHDLANVQQGIESGQWPPETK